MCWLPIKQQQLPVKQASLCKAARGTLFAEPGSPGRFMRCHLRDLQSPGAAVQVQPAGMGGAGNGSQPSHSLAFRLCSPGTQREFRLQNPTEVACQWGKSRDFWQGCSHRSLFHLILAVPSCVSQSAPSLGKAGGLRKKVLEQV